MGDRSGADGLRIALTEGSTTLNGHTVGEVHTDINGYEYRLVLGDTALISNVVSAGDVVVIKTPSTWVATNDVSAGLNATYPQVVGIALGTANNSEYFWVMRRGYYATVTTNGDDDIAAGVMLIPAPSTDKACDSLPGSATNTADGILAGIFGIAAADDVDANNTVAALINCRI